MICVNHNMGEYRWTDMGLGVGQHSPLSVYFNVQSGDESLAPSSYSESLRDRPYMSSWLNQPGRCVERCHFGI